MNPQLKGIERIEGTYAFDIRTCNRRLNINRFFWNMIKAQWRERYLQDPEGLMAEADLTEEEKALIRKEDWLGLVQNGVNFFVLEKFARVVKKTNLEVYAIMRGQPFEDFMKTRRVPNAR
ncbi:MAG: protocatechuate 3,4-dioxygenase [Pusillimonas sp.]|nr:protocatechuate 3,4-dioxygenase [Pusillimonas sp.]